MNTQTKILNMAAIIGINPNNSVNIRPCELEPIRWEKPLGWLAGFGEMLLECLLALTVGAAAGRFGGWAIGSLYVKYFKPVYLYDLHEITRWWTMPATFVNEGIFIGDLAGMITTAILQRPCPNATIAAD